MIVRWGLEELPGLLARGRRSSAPLLVASARWDALDAARPSGALDEVPSDRIEDAAAAAAGRRISPSAAAARSTSARRSRRRRSCRSSRCRRRTPARSGRRSSASATPDRRMRGGGAGAQPAGIVYEPELTLDLPRGETVGTAHERARPLRRGALRRGPQRRGRRGRARGRAADRRVAPAVVERRPRPRGADGAAARARCTRARRSAGSGLALGHAMAQALGGRYGLPHGALNAICLPPALRFNAPVAGDAIAASARRSAPTTPPRASRSWPGSAASSGCATSACRRTSCAERRRGGGRAPGARGEPAAGHARPRSPELLRSDLVVG